MKRGGLILDKKGSHVGMILSFAIFITFIIFLYSILNPAVKTGEDKTATLDYIQYQIMQNVSSNFTSASIGWDSTINPTGNCVQFDNLLGFLEIPPPYKIIIKNENNIIQSEPYLVADNYPDVEIIRGSADDKFFRIYNSPEFEIPEASIVEPCTKISDYEIGSVTSGGYVFEKNMYKLTDYYNNNYEWLRTEFKITPGSEFGFIFVQSNGTMINVGNPPASANVHVSEIPIQYIDDYANILSGFINVKVW